jgi:2-polyprenyl-6-methoxyphenol hydroxylase-like FAD-dependent oxidoreductase
LRRRGISTRLVEQKGERDPHSRALGLHARTLEIFDLIGIGRRFVERGRPVAEGVFHVGGGTAARLSFAGLDSPHPYILMLSQEHTEELLEGHLASVGGAVERQVTLERLAGDENAVVATLRRADGTTETLRAQYVVGCDGAHSTVRAATGQRFRGATYPEGFILADLRADPPWPNDSVELYLTPDGIFAIFPLDGERVRVIASEETPRDEDLSLDEVQALLETRLGVGVRLYDPIWLARFRVHRRIVDHFRIGRLFLAGDAAHIHSPAGAQGMNTGLQDAWNLGWKLAAVLRGEAPEPLLGTYEVERLPVARAVLQATNFLTQLGTLRAPPILQRVRAAVLNVVPPLVEGKIARGMAELDVSYPRSPLSDRSSGERFAHEWEKLGTRWVLFLSRGAPRPIVEAGVRANYGERIDVVESAVNLGARYVLVRPDGYVGVRTSSADRLYAYLERWFTTDTMSGVQRGSG